MRIIDIKNKIIDFVRDEREARRVIELLKKNQSEMHICDLDLVLLLVSLGAFQFISNKQFDLLCDSEFAQYLAPKTFSKDAVDFDDEKRINEIREEIAYILKKQILSNEAIDVIDNHELIGNVNIDALIANQATFINLQNNISIEARTSGIYSFALSQVGYRILYDVTLKNNADVSIKNLVLKITSTPNYVTFGEINIRLLQPHQPIMISDFVVTPQIDELLKLNEKQIGTLNFTLYDGETEIAKLSSEMIYYSYDTWVERLIPGSTALFVMPNEDSVKNIVRLTAQTLQKETGKASLDDYQSGDKNLVNEQVKALYDTLRQEGIGYITSPASYEVVGQKIRIPHDVLKGKQGTCIDLAILFVSCLESMGLNAGIVLIAGHAYACVFLEEEHLLSSPYSDATKMLDLCDNEKKVIFIECTTFTAGNDTTFEQACSLARENTWVHVNDPNFEVIDISISRASGYLPLPIKFDDVEKITIDLEVNEENSIRLKKKDFKTSSDKLKLTDAEVNKFDLWEKKLLDLSKRNELIDFKVDRNGQQILTFDNDGNLSINFLFDEFKEKKYQYTLIDSNIQGMGGTLSLPDLTEEQYNTCSYAVNDHKLLFIKRKTSLNSALKFFDRERRKAFEESGSNVLYMAIGFIEWFETERSIRPKYAPIILIPIDLKRHSKDSYSIIGRDEPAFLNISIFEFFHQEFKMNFDDLLTMNLFSDDSNISADTILNTVSEKLKRLKRARVIKTAAINIFRFSKAVMWQDVKYHREELAKNKVIKSILNRSYIVTEEEKLTENFDDDKSNPADLAIPLSADSSQIKAIKDCGEGKSFILQGPPGTGKSQTITNMIVNAIYHGKTVLFVAEKMAALEVVQRRLEKLKLDKFALEAHSIKSDKASVMEQFKNRIELNRIISDTDKYYKTSSDLKLKRDDLNKIINVLHKKEDYFLSFYDALVRSDGLDDIATIELNDDFVRNLNDDKFQEDINLINEFENQIIENGGYLNNPFILYRSQKYIPNVTKNKFRELGPKYKIALLKYNNAITKFQEENDIEFSISRSKNNEIILLLKDNDMKNVIPSLLNSNLINNEEISFVLLNGIKVQKELEKIRFSYADSILSLDINQALFDYDKAKNAGFFSRGKLQKACVKQIADLSRNPKLVKFEELPYLYGELKKIKDNIQILKNSMSRYEVFFGPSYSYKIEDYDFNLINEKYNVSKQFYANHKGLGDILLNKIVTKSNSFALRNSNEVIESYEELKQIENILETELGFDYSLCDKYLIGYSDIVKMIDKWDTRIDYLRNWSYLLTIYEKLQNNNLKCIIDYIESDNYDYSKNQLALIYQKSVYKHIMNEIVLNNNSGSFNAIELKHSSDTYKELINVFANETVKETAFRITSQTPLMTEKSAASSEIGILRAAITNKCRGKSLRQLFSEIPHIITKYFPVFLMSPISCAQFLNHNMPKFDIVIFDEASQMPTSEAIGAIARGKNLIVVGDSKQMPPTAFFQTKGSDDDYVDIDDQESILDDCSVIGMPSRQLDWHYRSKHESLIRFSNARFYNNSLVTFPSPNDMVTKVTLKNVKGVYDKRGKNNNAIEADAIIKEIERRLKSTELCKRSIGVVTFSSSQQELIEDKLDDFWAKNKKLEAKYLEMVNDPIHPLEPIIVKNLENIQGDERDVILFSVCYGPDKNGQMSYQFGPINKSGGEKRLNVAFSRARYEMTIFTSFEPSLLSHMNSNSIGAQEFYLFLKYAKDGGSTLAISNNSISEIPVGIEKRIAAELNKLGYKTVTDVGKSSFRVDIGIIDPNDENQYILGVICDSYSYENASTSRDRNIIQPSILKVLGWNLIRIWSFDYLDDPKFVINLIVDKIKELEKNPNTQLIENNNDNINIEYESEKIESISYAEKYTQFMRKFNVTDDHKSGEFKNSVKVIIQEILKLEVPISYQTLCNRVANATLCSRAGSDIQNAVNYALSMLNAKKTKNGEKIFIWNSDGNTKLEHYRVFYDEARDMEDIAKEEIIVAVKEVLLNHGPMTIDDLKRLTANCFGIKYVKAKVNETMDCVIEHYCNNKDPNKNILTMINSQSRIALKEQVK